MSCSRSVAGVPDAIIREVDSLPERLEGATQYAPNAQALHGVLLLNMPGVARYLVKDGRSIDVAIAPGASPQDVRCFLFGAARSALIHQRGEMPLHAATLLPPAGTRAIALCGPSGAGKSSLAIEFIRRGWRLVADDLTRITIDGNRALAWPSSSTVKLWRDACERQSIDTAGLECVRTGLDKFFVPVAAVCEPVTLESIIVLRIRQGEGLRTVSAAERLALLSENCTRPRQIAPLGRAVEHLTVAARIAALCGVLELYGARHAPVAALADRIAGHVAEQPQ